MKIDVIGYPIYYGCDVKGVEKAYTHLKQEKVFDLLSIHHDVNAGLRGVFLQGLLDFRCRMPGLGQRYRIEHGSLLRDGDALIVHHLHLAVVFQSKGMRHLTAGG